MTDRTTAESLLRASDPKVKALVEFAKHMAEYECHYADGCPPFSGTRHGDCHYCLARRALAAFDGEGTTDGK